MLPRQQFDFDLNLNLLLPNVKDCDGFLNRIFGALRRELEAPLLRPLFLFVLAVLLSYRWPAFASLNEQHTPLKRQPASNAAPKEKPVPFRAGEKLTYRASWSVFSNAASLELTAPERRDLFGHPTWHFRGIAHTLSSVRSIVAIDDQFDSYSDVSSLDCLQFETHLNEMGKSTNQVLHLVPPHQPSKLPPPIVIVPQDTRDPLGIVYSLRTVDWNVTAEFRAPAYDGHDLYEVRASRQAADEPVKVAAGAYSASRISISIFQNQKEVAAIHYMLWIAKDAARTPVLMEANLPFGTIRAELTSATE